MAASRIFIVSPRGVVRIQPIEPAPPAQREEDPVITYINPQAAEGDGSDFAQEYFVAVR